MGKLAGRPLSTCISRTEASNLMFKLKKEYEPNCNYSINSINWAHGEQRLSNSHIIPIFSWVYHAAAKAACVNARHDMHV